MRKTLKYYIYLAMNSVNILSQRNAAGSIYFTEKQQVKARGSSFASRRSHREKHQRSNLGITFISNQYHVLIFFVYLRQ